MMMRRPLIALFAFTGFSACAVLACGSLVDPATSSRTTPAATTTTTDASAAATTTLSGALTLGATAPAGARVALVWWQPNKTVISNNDVALGSNGTLSLDLPAPPDGYLGIADPNQQGKIVADDRPAALQPTDTTLRGASAGFIVYDDTNGNGRFDLTNAATGETSDRVLGLSEVYYLFYYTDGSALDYEKMRDSSGVSPMGYPPPGDPHLTCAPDGRSWTVDPLFLSPDITPSGNCTAWPDIDRPSICMGSAMCIGGEQWIPDAGPLPANWPCTITDAGP